MRAYILDNYKDNVYLVFEDLGLGAKNLAEKLGCDTEDFSVGGSFEVNVNEPINISKLWPYFTNNPSKRHLD